MCERHENSVTETFVKGLDAMSEDKGPRFSAKSKDAKSMVKEGLS